jgi:hypothetical protein
MNWVKFTECMARPLVWHVCPEIVRREAVGTERLHHGDVDRSAGGPISGRQEPADTADTADTADSSLGSILITLLCSYLRTVITRMITVLKAHEMAVLFLAPLDGLCVI